MEDFGEHDLADDDGGQADDDRAAPHADIDKALILRQQRAGEGDEAVGEHEAEHLIRVGVDALRARHVGVCAGCAQGAAALRAEEPIQQRDHRDGQRRQNEDRVGKRQHTRVAGGDEQRIIVDADRHIRLAAEDAQVDGIERKLGQNARQNRRDAHERVENARREAGEHADQKRRDHRDPHVAAADDEHGGHRAAGCDAAVHRQIGHIEDSIGNIHANRHDAPDHALRTGAGERVKQLGNLHWIVLLMIRMKPRERSAASLAHADVFENRFYSIAT